MTQKFKFSEGEKVLCFHGPLIYEAKALKCSIKDKQIKYYIHYAGWNKNWDEWVPEDRVLKYNEANVERQKEVFKQHNTAAAAGKNKKATLKGKKGELSGSAQKDSGASSGGSESRASTPSKELNSSLVAPSTTSTSSGRGRGKQPAKDHETPSKKEEENGIAASASTSVATKLDEKDEPIKKKRISSTVSEKATSTTPTPAQAAAATTPAASTTASATTNIAASTSTLSDSDSTSTTTATSTSATTNASAAGGNQTARSTDPTLESEETFLAKLEVKIKIPDELKQCLADDWDAITRQHKLIDVPAKITVQDIVDQYVVFKKTGKNSSNNKELAVTDVMNGIVEYFNVMIGSQLLYKFERPQYAEILQQHPDTPLSKLYGGFHLLRLFVKLGTMLGYSALDEKSMQMLLTHLNDFLKFLVKNCATYFNMSNFVNVTPEYVRNTQ